MQRVGEKHPDQGTACMEALRQFQTHRPGKKALPAGREMTKLQRDGSREEKGPGQDKG